MPLGLPGPANVLTAVGALRDSVGAIPDLVPRVALLLARMEAAMDRVDAGVERIREVTDRIDGMVDRVDQVTTDVAETNRRSRTVADRSAETQVRADAAAVGSQAVVERVNRLLDSYEPALQDLLDITQDMRRVISGLPGVGFLRRRGEEELSDEEVSSG